MKIRHLTAYVDDLDAAAGFYGVLLQLPTRTADGGVVVTVGETTMELRESHGTDACDHFAFDIPPGQLDEATSWLRSRGLEPLARDGEVQLEMPPGWNARSIYFAGPSGSVLELIARRDLDASPAAPFDATAILRVSEAGIATSDVPGDRRRLAEIGMAPFGGVVTDGFSAVGDLHGLLILVSAGRLWMPTEDHIATMAPLEVRIDAPSSLDLRIGAARVRSSAD